MRTGDYIQQSNSREVFALTAAQKIPRHSVTVVDYGLGNVHSLASAFEFIGAEVVVTGNPIAISRSGVIALPGVGSFPAAMRTIRQNRLDFAIYEALERPTSKLLGICLGMQILGQSSVEDGGELGLGILNFSLEQFDKSSMGDLSLPHIGFNTVHHNQNSTLFKGLGQQADYYFVHEYRATYGGSQNNESLCHYGEPFLAAVDNGRVFGTQFHPEKSQKNGLRLLTNFLKVHP